MRVKVGDKIFIYPQETFSIMSKNLPYVQMIVNVMDTTRIRGEMIIEPGDFTD